MERKKLDDERRGGYYFEVKYKYEFLEDFRDLYDDPGEDQIDSEPSGKSVTPFT